MSAAGRRRHQKNGSQAQGSSAIAVVIQEILAKQQLQRSKIPGLSESDALLEFCKTFQNERSFAPLPCNHGCTELLQLLKSQRVTSSWLGGGASEDHTHRALMCLRLLLRDEGYQHKFMEGSSPIPVLAEALSRHTKTYFSSSHTPSTTDILKELTNIFQKLSNTSYYGDQLVVGGVSSSLVQLLSARDLVPLQCSLCALTNLCKSSSGCEAVGALGCLPSLLHILHHYDSTSQRLTSDLLLLLSRSNAVRAQVRDIDGLPLCLRLLHSEDLHILHRMVGVLERFAEDSELQEEIRLMGGIPLLLALFSKKSSGSGPAAREQGTTEKLLALRAACCSTVTQLVLNDSNAQHIVQGNGVYLLSCQILPHPTVPCDRRVRENLQRHALRALRFLFSMERNRQLFKRLLPPRLFEAFIDVGHYVREPSAYSPLVHMINNLPESDIALIHDNIEATNQNREPMFVVGSYAVLELLGSGAFGSVYKVKKKNSDTVLAMKEIKVTHPLLGSTMAEKGNGIGQILSEVNIMKEQLRHPNVVRYYKCFQEGGHLYITMELLEGAPLIEHIASLQEKGQRFSEQRLWRIFTQLVLALRYIHKEKRVIHRDLTPSNIMLGEGDKLTITDFGLAKQKQREFSVMKSVVGTMLYWCPELVQSEPYNEKADIWAAGCILHQMASLKPPFHSSNMLALAKKIAEVDYEPLPEGLYSPLVGQVIRRCLTADPDQRPDSIELGSLLSGVLMQQLDHLSLLSEGLEKRLAKERQRTIKHFHKAVWSEQKYQQLLSSSEPPRESTANPVRRKLSASFTSTATVANQSAHEVVNPERRRGSQSGADSYSPNLGHLVCGAGGSQRARDRRSTSQDRSTEEGDLTDGNTSDNDSLQRSSDSVFLENIPDETVRSQYPPSPGMECSPFESNPPAPRGVVRENPLTSRTNGSGNGGMRLRSQSAVVAGSRGVGLEQFAALHSGRSPLSLQGRSHSAFMGAPRPSLVSGPFSSPLSHKSRTPSTSSVLSICPRHVREISDPISQLMCQLHKLLFLTQLPPSPVPSMRQLLVERYKRNLFDRNSSPGDLKTEIHRLANGTSDVVPLLSEVSEGPGLQPRMLQKALAELAACSSPNELVSPVDTHEALSTVTYEQLQDIVESLLVENSYYQINHRQHRENS